MKQFFRSFNHQFRSIVAQSSSTAGGTSGTGFHPGRNFYQGYHGYGRAFTQANNQNAGDDDDSRSPSNALRKQRHKRRQSIGNSSRGEVIAAIREQRRLLSTSSRDVNKRNVNDQNKAGRPRSNSTASISSNEVNETLDPNRPPPPPPEELTSKGELSVNESVSLELAQRIHAAKDSNDFNAVKKIVNSVYTLSEPTIELWDTALEALCVTRPDSLTVEDAVKFYNDMLKRGLRPTERTYSNLITILCLRDNYVQSVTGTVNNRKSWDKRLEIESRNLNNEQNFEIALSIFNLAVKLNRLPNTIYTYNWLLKSCEYHKDVDSAINVFSVLESHKKLKPQHTTYAILINIYGIVGDIEGANVVFDDYGTSLRQNRINSSPTFATLPINKSVTVYNSMISANFSCGEALGAIELFQVMLESNTHKLRPDTITAIIEGFYNSGDISSALEWLKRVSSSSMEGSDIPHASISSFYLLMTALLKNGNFDESRELFELLKKSQTKFSMIPTGLDFTVFTENVINIVGKNPENINEVINFANEVLSQQMIELSPKGIFFPPINDLIHICSIFSRFDLAMGLFIQWTEAGKIQFVDNGSFSDRSIWKKFVSVSTGIVISTPNISLQQMFDVHRIAIENNILCNQHVYLKIIKKIDEARLQSEGDFKLINLTMEQWRIYSHITLQSFRYDIENNNRFRNLNESKRNSENFVSDILNTFGRNPEDITKVINVNEIGYTFSKLFDNEYAIKQLEILGYQFNGANNYTNAYAPPINEEQINQPLPSSYTPFESSNASISETPPTTPESNLGSYVIDPELSNIINRHDYRKNLNVSPNDCYDALMSGIANGITGSPASLISLTNALGRNREIEKAKKIYTHAYQLISELKSFNERSLNWFRLEDAMVSGLGHGGDVEGATIHRMRILQAGGAPSADSYAACINNVRETTDDATLARELWNESQSLGVKANTFLYNSIISKLSKARKAHAALEIMDKMTAERVKPSSVTYGAIINACTRIGDEGSAINFFNKMVENKQFRLRVPPFNTMIQFYTQTKPNRERALHYFAEMIAADVSPSEHTYKLLLDAYGSIEPVDKQSLNKVFETIINDPKVEVLGTHWASMIHSIGCLQKDVDGAIKMFESIETHPTSKGKHLPDAIIYEALLNVLVENHKQYLIPEYMKSIEKSKIHQTAYISNLLIRGYASSGDLDKSREVFESMIDPPMGTAASGNHPGENIGQNVPVYREPSTWTEMIKAELEYKNKEKAKKLVERMEERMYPLAVTTRIASLIEEGA